MPFDTTYHIYSGNNNNEINFIAPGGQDTSIYLNPGEIPPGMDSLYYEYSSLKQQMQGPYGEKNTVKDDAPLTSFFFIIVLVVVVVIIRQKIINTLEEDSDDNSSEYTKEPESKGYLTYYGDQLNFTDEELVTVLNKRFPYYKKLSDLQQKTFIDRVQLFIADKIFKVHDTIAYKEMPILISAAAIQLTLGLRRYLLPNFRFIHVYPEEFLAISPTIRILEGNVNGHTINLSWKHFLKGYEDGSDGQNVGLHELSHALYYQNFVTEENVDTNFRDTFDEFNDYGNKVFHQEALPGNDLYSDYALKNFQEFWAESIEIFFEKPVQLKTLYPRLYDSLVEILNQDPAQFSIS
jgi:hypothetical protein